MGFVSSVHGNAGFLRPRKHVVQAEASMQSVIRMNANLMPHQMKSLGAGRQDVRMVLPSELNWKRMQEDVNEVTAFGFSGSIFLFSSTIEMIAQYVFVIFLCLRFRVVLRLLFFLSLFTT